MIFRDFSNQHTTQKSKTDFYGGEKDGKKQIQEGYGRRSRPHRGAGDNRGAADHSGFRKKRNKKIERGRKRPKGESPSVLLIGNQLTVIVAFYVGVKVAAFGISVPQFLPY